LIESLIELLRPFGFDYGFLRVFNYITVRIMMAALTALLFVVLFGHKLIVQLYRNRFRDTGGDFLSLNTQSKRGTPTGGGVLIILAVTYAVILWGRITNPFVAAAMGAFLYFGLVGWIDDWQKVRLKSSLFGLGQMAKTLLELLFIVPFAWWLVSSYSPLPAGFRTTFFVPFFKGHLGDMGPWLFGAFVVFAFYSIVNAVNIADGLDGLLSGPAVTTALVYGAFAYVLGNAILSRYLLFSMFPGIGELAVFSAALVGGLLGFLWYNAYPAEVFMGDTGSMSIGASLAAMAFLTRQEMLFPLVGGVFVVSIGSSLIQEKIGLRIGRRIFLRAPLHHGLTYRGIAEPKLVVRYWIVSILLALMAALSLKVR
jgi:phospho-N-acetylmuramoyl-pentapeptide-transferase